MLAEHDPELLSAYDTFYSRLTLTEKVLPPQEKEIVWIALLAAAREGVGKLHLKRGEEAGLSREEIQAAVALSAVSEAYTATHFAATHWAEYTPADTMLTAYRSLIATARGPIEPRVAELALIICHAARTDEKPMRLHLESYFHLGGSADALSEALAFLFLPLGANLLIEAVEIWAKAAPELDIPAPFAA
nr:carboxymuconolactone decarboxylase family protein [Acuticoccus mangrovi]